MMNGQKPENRGIDKDLFDAICRYMEAETASVMRLFGMSLVYIGDGKVGMKMNMDNQYTTGGQRVHGGTLATLADTAMGLSCISTNGKLHKTVELNLNYIKPAFSETDIIAEANVIHRGNTIEVTEVSLLNDEGKYIAKGRGTFIRDTKTPTIYEKLERYKTLDD